jgi:hypothetical protein
MTDPVLLIEKLVQENPKIKGNLLSLQTMINVKETRHYDRLQESEEKVYILAYELSCEKSNSEQLSIQLKEKILKLETANQRLQRKEELYDFSLKERGSLQQAISVEKKKLQNCQSELRQEQSSNRVLKKQNLVLETQLGLADKLAVERRGTISQLMKYNNGFASKASELKEKVATLEGEREDLPEKLQNDNRQGREVKSKLAAMLMEWDQPASIIPMKRPKD